MWTQNLQVPDSPSAPADWLQLCLDKGLATEEALRKGVETLESKAAMNLGAKLTALAWTDPAFKVGTAFAELRSGRVAQGNGCQC